MLRPYMIRRYIARFRLKQRKKKILSAYKDRISIQGLPNLSNDTEVCAREGKIVIEGRLSTGTNVQLVAVLGGELTIKDEVTFNRNCIVVARGRIEIGQHCTFGPNVCIYDHNHRFDENGVKEFTDLSIGEVVIEKNCWIGAGVIILKGSHIGEGCVIGAGTVVTGDIPSHSIVTSGRDLVIKLIEPRQ